jgi:hypothetical protein
MKLVSLITVEILFCVIFCHFSIATARAQVDCQKELKEAEAKYYNGRFEEARNLAMLCFVKGNATDADKVQACKLIAQSYLAQDSLDQAKDTIKKLLQIDPSFMPDQNQDTPQFISFVTEVIQDLQKLPVQPVLSLRKFRSDEVTLSEKEVQSMLLGEGFYDTRWNRRGSGVDNNYKPVVIDGILVVVDSTTGLMWQQAGSSEQMTFTGATEYIRGLNAFKMAGFSDWRLPTLEEAMSLVEPRLTNDNLHKTSSFERTQTIIWTMDKANDNKVWVVGFNEGRCFNIYHDDRCYVRAVRVTINPISVAEKNVRDMLLVRGFYDSRWNPSGKGVANQYKLQAINGDRVVLDFATGLMWQQAGASYKNFDDAKEYIGKLNKQKFAGFSDWRLPTLEETMTLMESRRLNESLYVDELFDKRFGSIWTADILPNGKEVWVVSFSRGGCYRFDIDKYATLSVRAVRGVAYSQ